MTSFRAISKILFILGLYNFLAYLECVRNYAWSKGHSDPDLGSVLNFMWERENNFLFDKKEITVVLSFQSLFLFFLNENVFRTDQSKGQIFTSFSSFEQPKRIPNICNEYFVYLLLQYFHQVKVLN